ncbi:hypothetical protein [Aliarcobacter cryaerophilus]|jgi:apolipoprotein N-acyltransferase|uniref:hypothetical protein n=1 Tax=Aliarcobacter cryaerophilus TaxID=28198 RepID=UPI0021B625FA|nr:hypothetical protein [Aliarcobacter cryaerophilus]MCT7546046.1 hypothetical protein [Aliarcobacter cryaerophilus]
MAKIVGVLLEKEEDTRGSILGLLLILFLFAGIYLRIHIEQNEEKKIRETVFVQAISEKYKFKNKELQHSFIEWQKINILNGSEIK